MTNTYVELWDVDSGNLVGCFDDLVEAIAFLKQGVAEYGVDVLSGYFLMGDAEDAAPIADDELRRLVVGHPSPVAVAV